MIRLLLPFGDTLEMAMQIWTPKTLFTSPRTKFCGKLLIEFVLVNSYITYTAEKIILSMDLKMQSNSGESPSKTSQMGCQLTLQIVA